MFDTQAEETTLKTWNVLLARIVVGLKTVQGISRVRAGRGTSSYRSSKKRTLTICRREMLYNP